MNTPSDREALKKEIEAVLYKIFDRRSLPTHEYDACFKSE